MQMIRWMCGISLKDRRTNEELRRLVGVEPITTFIRSAIQRWYGNVMRKGDEDWAKKCMGYRVEGRRPVERPRKTWLESVEADRAKLEIDKEDVHDQSKWRRNVNVMKRKSKPNRKTDYKQTNYVILYFHKSCPIESRVLSFNNSPKCMIKIFLESDKISYNIAVT